MASVLRNAAAIAVNKGQPSSFYSKDKVNPVLQALNQEIKLYVGFMKKRTAPGYTKPAEESASRAADTLFELWNKYEPKLERLQYEEKLLDMGDFLMSIKEYKLALWQCYERYLKYFGDVSVEEITAVDTFKTIFFPNGFGAKNAGLTFRALMGKSISRYQGVKLTDPKLQNSQSVDQCLEILTFLRLVLQVVLPKESLCWLVYNGTIHIYSISRQLMSLGHSSKVLEFLLWASVCMETSVPLLGIKYLHWRATLYTAVCQCYYDCKSHSRAESFARRGLTKINELAQLESMSSGAENPFSEVIFRQATVKMAVMVFRRTVFETRRKPKGLLRPKTRANLKDAQGLPWPRTPTEKLLVDMFEGSAAQFLCILESLTDSNRRTLITSPPAPDNEPEILDVYAELLMAAQEILAGGGGSHGNSPKPDPLGMSSMSGIENAKSLITMATEAEDGVPLSAAVRLVKLAYSFEQWDAFDSLVEQVLIHIKICGDNKFASDEKALEILLAIERVNSNRRHKRQASVLDDASVLDQSTLPPPPSQCGGASTRSLSQINDDLVQLAEVLLSIVMGPFTPDSFDVDMVVDAGIFLWKKCKAIFEKYQTGSTDNAKYLQKMENAGKWVYILDIVHQVLCWCGISSVDPALTAEVVLRLALVLESATQADNQEDSKSLLKESKTTLSDLGPGEIPSQTVVSHMSVLSTSILNLSVREQLLQARDILELGLENVSYARQAVVLSDGKSIADIAWVKDGIELATSDSTPSANVHSRPSTTVTKSRERVKSVQELNRELFTPESVKTETTAKSRVSSAESEDNKSLEEEVELLETPDLSDTGPATAVWNTIKDLHLELLLLYHRVCLKLAAVGPDPALKIPKPFKRVCGNRRSGSSRQLSDRYIETADELVSRCNKSLLSKALLNMQRALIMKNGDSAGNRQKLLEDTVTLITRAQNDERKLYMENTVDFSAPPVKAKVPPPPVLMSRTDSTMIFRPAPFQPSSGEKVAWYRLFGRPATGKNIKARLSDYNLPGTGEQIPAFRCELRASGLAPNERYIFAVAAYTMEGKLIGDSIGETSRPILASHPLPVLMTWAFLSQIAYQVGCYEIAQQACGILWSHFVADPPPPEGSTYVTSAQRDFSLTLYRLNKKVVTLTSPVLLRQTLTSIFVSVDISVRQGQMFCDRLCDRGPLYQGQMNRLAECEKMLIGLELAGWLNEANLALQAVVQCYGLLTPLVFYKIPSIAVIQVLERCHAVLQEVPAGLRQKRPATIADSLHHMTACITYHLAKVLRTFGQKTLANNLNDAGRKLLALETSEVKEQNETLPDVKEKTEGTVATETGTGESNTLGRSGSKKKKPAKKMGLTPVKEEPEGPVNEELKALEAHMMSMSKQSQSDHELSGNEDPNILHAYIAFLPSKVVFKELVKFKRRVRYLEFLVHLVQKTLTEGLPETALDWCEDTVQWLTKRNEQILGNRAILIKQPGVMTVAGDDPKKFAAAMVEYTKDKEKAEPSPRLKGAGAMIRSTMAKAGRRKPKYKTINVNPNMTEATRQAQEEAELKALDKLSLHLPELIRSCTRKNRLRKVTMDEMPFRVQMNTLQGVSQFSVLLQKLEKREKILGSTANNIYRTSFMDQEWFTFETAGTLVVGWEGGPSPLLPDGEGKKPDHGIINSLDLAEYRENKATGIEMAAAAATANKPLSMLNVIPEVYEDTPRTYRSDAGPFRVDHRQSRIQPETSSTLTSEVTLLHLRKTFHFFQRALVLAYRGRHWTQLQNACRALWNCAHTAMLRAYTATPSSRDAGLITTEMLRSLMWEPFYMATDFVLEMISHLQVDLEAQAAKAKSRGHNLGTYFDSWTGSVKEEKGGASLKFDTPLDDISALDMRWVRRLVLRSLEMLFYEQKWERLADIALRFNAFSNNRYAEQVMPLLVQAQRQLTDQINKVGGFPPPQPHYKKLLRQLGGVVTAQDYLYTQLKLDIDKTKLSAIDPGGHIDPEGHNVYIREVDGRRLVSVPLDVTHSLETLREALDKSHYTARALQHSRKLLILYLAGQQNVEGGLSRQVSRVDFVANTAQPQPTMPPDMKKEDFPTLADNQTSPLPKSQLNTVIASYDKTIAMLLAKNQKGLAAQAVHELGNLHYHAGNIRAAYRWWTEGLDIVLSMTDCLHSWRQVLCKTGDLSMELLNRCGLWGCVLGGILASKIAQYVVTSDLGLRMDCCFLSGYFFKALFRSSLPHPMSDRDYALYEVGEGCEVTYLLPGIDLLSDRFRADGRQLVAALRWVTEELARGRYNLFILPLLTLNQYLTTYVCRDLQRSVDGRILKVRVLADLGLFLEAFITVQRLLHGERLPHTGDSNFRQVESKLSTTRFNTAKPITSIDNLKVLENILDKRLSSNLSMLYGPHMTCHLLLVQAHLLVTLADTLPVIPAMGDLGLSDANMKAQSVSSLSLASKGARNLSSTTAMPSIKRGAAKTPLDGITEKEGDRASEDESTQPAKRFTDSKTPPTVEAIKGILLGMADQMVTALSDALVEAAENDQGVDNLGAAELELVVLCRLEQASIANQKQHAPMAARIMLSAMKLLQNSAIFKPRRETPPQPRPSSMKSKTGSGRAKAQDVKVPETENSQFMYQDFQSRSRIDARLWLLCRLALVRSLLMEIRGMGDIKGPDNKVLTELADCRQYCAEGVAEAEACGDPEMQAEFFLQGVLLNILEGKSLEHTLLILQDMMKVLMSIPHLSLPGEYLMALTLMLQTDLQMTSSPREGHDKGKVLTDQALSSYLRCQAVLLQQMEDLGEKIEHYYPEGEKEQFSAPVAPIHNIYLPHMLRLSQIKLRIGHTLARSTAKHLKHGDGTVDTEPYWTECLGVLMTALELSQASVTRQAHLEAEILLNMGKVQRQLVSIGRYQSRHAANTLIEAIKTSYASDHDLGLIRQAYLEIALIYLSNSGQTRPDGSAQDGQSDSGEEGSQVSRSSSRRVRSRRLKGRKDRSFTRSKEELNEQEKERRAAWLAVRCAAAVAQAQRSRTLLTGDTAVTSQKISGKAVKDLPEFIALDLISPYVLGKQKKIYMNEIEEELSTMIDVQEDRQVETYDDEVNKVKAAAHDISWIHMLGYQTILQRLCSSSTIHASSGARKDGSEKGEPGSSTSMPGFDLGFISHAQVDTGLHCDVVRTMLYSGPWAMRVNHLHNYLANNLPAYGSSCCAIYPPEALVLPLHTELSATELSFICTSYSDVQLTREISEVEVPVAGTVAGAESGTVVENVQETSRQLLLPPGSQSEPFKPVDKSVISSSDNELSLQWYQPSLEEGEQMLSHVPRSGRRLMLLYSVSKKGVTGVAAMPTGVTWVSMADLMDLHDRLVVLSQRAEISLVEKSKKEASPPSTTPAPLKGKKSQRIKALSPKVQRDEQLEMLLRQCIDDTTSLLGVPTESSQEDINAGTQPPSSEFPFDVARVNVRNFEMMFDPSFGLTLKGTDLLTWMMKQFP